MVLLLMYCVPQGHHYPDYLGTQYSAKSRTYTTPAPNQDLEDTFNVHTDRTAEGDGKELDFTAKYDRYFCIA